MKLFQNTLTDVRDKIDPVLKTAQIKEESVKKDAQERERKPDEGKSRWERDPKDAPQPLNRNIDDEDPAENIMVTIKKDN